MKKKKLSKIMIMHYWKLTYRSFLFLGALILYIYNKIHNTGSDFSGFDKNKVVLTIIWIIYAFEMILRFLPSSLESMGCQKQFERNYKPTGKPVSEAILLPGIRTFAVLIAWIILNGIF